MVFASICEHASNVFIFASSEHFTNHRWRAASTLENYRWRAASTTSYFVSLPLAGISLLLSNVVLRRVIDIRHLKQQTSPA